MTVNKANSIVTVWPAASPITYGQTLAASTLTGGSASPAGSFAFTSPSTAPNAGTAFQGVTYTPTDTANYNPATASVSVTVHKANSIVTVWPTASPITYGQTLAASSLSGGTATPAGSFAFASPSTAPNAGTTFQGVTYTPTDTVNYNSAIGSVSVTVNKANSTVTVTCPTGTPYNGLEQTPCSAEATAAGMSPLDVTGTISYSNNINAGSATADANWDGDANHNGNSGSGGFTISPINATVTAVDDIKTVGTLDPPLNTTSTGFIASDLGAGAITFNATRVAGETVGTYDYYPFGGRCRHRFIIELQRYLQSRYIHHYLSICCHRRSGLWCE